MRPNSGHIYKITSWYFSKKKKKKKNQDEKTKKAERYKGQYWIN